MSFISSLDSILPTQEMRKRLPDALRTEHWYNDWQHAVFITIFDHLSQSIKRRNQVMTERHFDKLTVYLYVHFMCEEEGMTWSVAKGVLDQDQLERHQAIHLTILGYWQKNIQAPFKGGALKHGQLMDAVEDYYQKILAHIEEFDQETYGQKSDRDEDTIRTEIAHIAKAGLPLSPNMQGAVDVVRLLSPGAGQHLNLDRLPRRAVEPLGTLRLVPALGEKDSLHRRLSLA